MKMPFLDTLRSIQVALSFASIVICSEAIFANAGPSNTAAFVAGEPTGLEGVEIRREQLTIDLRPEERGEPAKVEAIYELYNSGDEVRLSLLFAFGSAKVSRCQVSLNNQPLQGKMLIGASLPVTWQPPRTTPALYSGHASMEFAGAWRSVAPFQFEVVFPKGESTLRVTYREQCKTSIAGPGMYRQFAYILSPAAAWNDFRRLDLTIHVPKEWECATNLELESDQGKLSGTFSGLPKTLDGLPNIGITCRPRVSDAYDTIKSFTWPVMIAVLILGLSTCLALSYYVVKRRNWSHALSSALFAFLYALAILCTGLFFLFGVDWLFSASALELEAMRRLRLENGQALPLFGLIILSGFCAVIGFALALLSGFFALRFKTSDVH